MTTVAGTKSQINWDNGTWVILDIGFAKERRSCGLAVADGKCQNLRFAEAELRITETIKKSQGDINLLIEAPLSVCFDKAGNPTGRSIEMENNQHRYWYVGPGCAVMVAPCT